MLLKRGSSVFEKFGVRKVIVFGSVANGVCSEKSDLDILSTDIYHRLSKRTPVAILIEVSFFVLRDHPFLFSFHPARLRADSALSLVG